MTIRTGLAWVWHIALLSCSSPPKLANNHAQLPPLECQIYKVINTTPRPAGGSGTLAIYIEITGRDDDGKVDKLYSIYLGNEKTLPNRGETWQFCYRLDLVKGWVMGRSDKEPEATIRIPRAKRIVSWQRL